MLQVHAGQRSIHWKIMYNHRNLTSYPGHAVLDATRCFKKPHTTHDMSGHGATRRPSQSGPLFGDTRDLYTENQYRHSNHFHHCHSYSSDRANSRWQICIHGNGKATFTFIYAADTFFFIIQNRDGKWFKHTAELTRWKVLQWFSWCWATALSSTEWNPSAFFFLKYETFKHLEICFIYWSAFQHKYPNCTLSLYCIV